jgi:AcrR family transcriptional regulator
VSRRSVTAEQLVAAADVVARRDGIHNVTVRTLCTELGGTAPAVYRRFAAKELIVDRVLGDIVHRIELPGPEAGDSVVRPRNRFGSAHDEVGPYAGLAARTAHEIPRDPAARRNRDFLLELLVGAGLCDADADADADADEAESPGRFFWGLDHVLDSIWRELGSRAGAGAVGR